jgi:hypothetical protein
MSHKRDFWLFSAFLTVFTYFCGVDEDSRGFGGVRYVEARIVSRHLSPQVLLGLLESTGQLC